MNERARIVEAWLGVLLGPIAALTQLEANYALVLRACSAGQEWLLHVVSVGALMVTLLAGVLAFQNRRRDGALSDYESGTPHLSFMAALGLLISGLMTLVIIAQWIAVFVYAPCHRWD